MPSLQACSESPTLTTMQPGMWGHGCQLSTYTGNALLSREQRQHRHTSSRCLKLDSSMQSLQAYNKVPMLTGDMRSLVPFLNLHAQHRIQKSSKTGEIALLSAADSNSICITCLTRGLCTFYTHMFHEQADDHLHYQELIAGLMRISRIQRHSSMH